jgi:hypothetical protein
MKIADILSIREENVGAATNSSVDTVPDLPSANQRGTMKPIARRFIHPRQTQTTIRSPDDLPGTRLHEMIPPHPQMNQMVPPAPPEQMSMAAAIKPTGEIEDAAAAVPPKPVMELFDVRAPVKQVNQSTYTFTVDGKPFAMEFEPAETPGSIEAVLSRTNVGYTQNQFDTLNDFGKNPVVVYSTAIAILQKYLKVYRPNVVFFYGFGPEQQRVYAKIANYVIGRSPDYVVQIKGETVAFVRRDLVQEEALELNNDEFNRIAQDKAYRRKPDMRKKKFVAMPGNQSTYPAL